METKLLNFNDLEAREIVLNGDVIALPTETVYGLGVIYDSKEAFDKLCNLKKRVPDKPFTIMVSNKAQIEEFVDITPKMKKIIDVFMPGEVTFLFPHKDNLAYHLTLNSDCVGIRISGSDKVSEFIARVGKPMLVTSANMSGEPALYNELDVKAVFDGSLKGIIEGKCESNLPSTIVKIDHDNLILIRQGSVSFEDILKVWEE